MAWTIASEHHVSPSVHYNGRDFKEIEFFYAIRRLADGSLLFRAETLKFAEEILDGLIESHSEMRAA